MSALPMTWLNLTSVNAKTSNVSNQELLQLHNSHRGMEMVWGPGP